MGESVSSLMRRGVISARAAAGKPGILSKTKVNRPNEEPFHGKQGKGDQGGADWNKPLDGGDKSVAGTGHIDTKQSRGSKARASGPVSKGGSAGAQKQPVKQGEIDVASQQKPDFPKGGSKVKKAKWKTPSKAASAAKREKAGAQSASYGAGGSRP